VILCVEAQGPRRRGRDNLQTKARSSTVARGFNHSVKTMTVYRLHYFPESGNSYKLALMLTLCGQTFEPIWTDFAGGATRTPEWRAAFNAMGEIPVLEEDGVRLTQTAPILLQLADRYGRYGGENSKEKFEILRWLFWDNHKLTGYMATYRYHRTFTPKPDPQVLAYFRRRLDDFLSILDQHLQSNDFAVGDRPTLADFSLMAYLSYPKEETGYDLAVGHSAVHAWLSRIARLPGWRPPYDLLPGRRLVHYA
jgi:glutathione S-transferase